MLERRSFISMSILAIMALVALIAIAVIVRNCRKILNPRVPRVVIAGPYEFVSADTGASLTVKVGRRRTRQVILQDIAAPSSGLFSSTSTSRLQEMAGQTITVQYEKRGLFRSDADGSLLDGEAVVQPETAGDGEVQQEDVGTEARGPLMGIVFGSSGINLNLAQVEAGYATCHEDAPKEWKAAEAKAKKLKFGIWSEEDGP